MTKAVVDSPNPQTQPPEEEKRPSEQLKQARGLAKNGQWRDAVSVLKKARIEFPDNPTVLGELGWAAFNDGDRSLAREASLRAVALELESDFPEAHRTRILQPLRTAEAKAAKKRSTQAPVPTGPNPTESEANMRN